MIKLSSHISIQYALRDTLRGFATIPIYQVNVEGKIEEVGSLIPVRAEGFVMCQVGGATSYSPGLPWWLFDMRPQGYLGRAFSTRHSAQLDLPTRLIDWGDTHALRALLAHGHDVVGNFLLGDIARERFLNASKPAAIKENQKPKNYATLTLEAAHGDAPGSFAGGEQPKFTTYAITPDGPQHLIVKFSELEKGAVSERWRDLLLAEYLALDTLRGAGISAVKATIIDCNEQRFLEVKRFDRIGSLGRCGLISLAAIDAEFVGAGSAWPMIVRRLVDLGQVPLAVVDIVDKIWAFGMLIGNTDMHNGNLSFIPVFGQLYDLAPVYDMTPMAFAPRSGGGLPDVIPEVNIHAQVSNQAWRWAEKQARLFLTHLKKENKFSQRFMPCIAALEQHIEAASVKISRLG